MSGNTTIRTWFRCALATCVVSTSAASAIAKPARPAPALAAPTGRIVNVNTEAQLQAAVQALTSNTTIVVAPGTYRLTRTLYVKGTLADVGIRGASNNADDVVIAGLGMKNASYGNVPYGIWTGQGVNGVTIANLTIRDFYFHPIILNAGTERPRIYNTHLIDAGQQFIKSNPDASGGGVDNGILEYSVLEFTTYARDNYPKGIDIAGADGWIIRHNLFRNLQAQNTLLGPAILAWKGTRNTLVEGNTFFNCARGVMFGSDDAILPSHRGGIIRNNFFYRSSSQPGDVGLYLSHSPDTKVLNNTLLLSGTYSAAIEYRYGDTRNATIGNNLTDTAIRARDGGTATLFANVTNATPSMFVNPAGGNLHLSSSAGSAIDRGQTVTDVKDDWDGLVRPTRAAFDVGADELDR